MYPEDLNFEDMTEDEEFDQESALEEIKKEMAEILEKDPDAAPMMEELAKLLSVVTEPDSFLRHRDVEVDNGTYSVLVSPAPGASTKYSISLCFFPSDEDAHKIGPVTLAEYNSMQDAEDDLDSFCRELENRRPMEFTDIYSKWRFSAEGVFMPYDTAPGIFSL